jgi:hypothetical protein
VTHQAGHGQPAFFGAGRAGRTDVAERAEELLDEGFGQLA